MLGSIKGLLPCKNTQPGRCKGQSLRQEIFRYDEHDRLVDYLCIGPSLRLMRKGSNSIARVLHLKIRQSGANHDWIPSRKPKCGQISTRLTNTHPDYYKEIDLEYDENVYLLQDD
ncbi:hypothetical protein MKX08_005108 [Trichoderma sp. CBMAI-0020]|nr:hypothetical protein MKX08_005108 [Trichoderma sp. CBMAI-0020]